MSPRIDEASIRHIARLARIRPAEEKIPMFLEQFREILSYFDKLDELDTAAVPPLVRAVELQNVMADDEEGPCLPTEEAMAAAPVRDGDFFRVPKVLGDS